MEKFTESQITAYLSECGPIPKGIILQFRSDVIAAQNQRDELAEDKNLQQDTIVRMGQELDNLQAENQRLAAENEKLTQMLNRGAEIAKENGEILSRKSQADATLAVSLIEFTKKFSAAEAKIQTLSAELAVRTKEAEKYRQMHFEHEYYVFANLDDESLYQDAVKDMKKTCPLSWESTGEGE